MSDYHLLSALVLTAVALALVLYAIFKVFWPVKIDSAGPVSWDDEINGDASTLGRDRF